MLYFLSSIILFGLSVVIHVIVCRARKIRKLTFKMFCLIALGVLAVYIALLVFGKNPEAEVYTLWTMPLGGASVFLYLLLIPFYFTFYHSIAVDSPTRVLLNFMKSRPSCTYEELVDLMAKSRFIESRLDALIEHRVVESDGKVYRLNPQGLVAGRMLDMYQRISNRPKGG